MAWGLWVALSVTGVGGGYGSAFFLWGPSVR